MKKTNVLLIIDAQYDFCDPSGSLFVNGADVDMVRLGNFIDKNSKSIDFICLSQDMHHVIDISHPKFWNDINGNFPSPFTKITYGDVVEGKFTPLYEKVEALEYLKKVDESNQYPHIIWPEHCIIDTNGCKLIDCVLESVDRWNINRDKEIIVVEKGINPLTEHFGMFEANIPNEKYQETMFNKKLIDKLNEFDNIYLAGEAKDYCVVSSLKQMMKFPDLAKKIIILEDCMSIVQENNIFSDNIFSEAKDLGVRFVLSTSNIIQ